MIAIDFRLLRSPYCKISYLLADEHLDLGTLDDSVIWTFLFERPFRFIGFPGQKKPSASVYDKVSGWWCYCTGLHYGFFRFQFFSSFQLALFPSV